MALYIVIIKTSQLYDGKLQMDNHHKKHVRMLQLDNLNYTFTDKTLVISGTLFMYGYT